MKWSSSNPLSKEQKKSLINVMGSLFEKYRLFKYLTIDNFCAAEDRTIWEKFCKEIEWAVNVLPFEEQEVIRERYMVDDYVRDYEVYESRLFINHTIYTERKINGLYNMTLILQRENNSVY